jgi:hypothetical protein
MGKPSQDISYELKGTKMKLITKEMQRIRLQEVKHLRCGHNYKVCETVFDQQFQGLPCPVCEPDFDYGALGVVIIPAGTNGARPFIPALFCPNFAVEQEAAALKELGMTSKQAQAEMMRLANLGVARPTGPLGALLDLYTTK